jgi:hypothetical protein
LKTRGLLEIFVDCGLISKKGRGLSANIAGISLVQNFFFQWEIWWTCSTIYGPGGMAQVHGGPSRRGQEGAAAPCWRVCARAHRCSLAVVERCEPDEAVPEGCSLEHEW